MRLYEPTGGKSPRLSIDRAVLVARSLYFTKLLTMPGFPYARADHTLQPAHILPGSPVNERKINNDICNTLIAVAGAGDYGAHCAERPCQHLAFATCRQPTLVGENNYHVVENNGSSLEAIAKKYNVGFLALLQANPGIDPYVPRHGSVLTIPQQALRQGIVIDLAELRLYYIRPVPIA